jgi:small subunit ribosomal protein S6
MPFYESTFIVRPDASPQQVEALAEEVTGMIKEHGGAVTKTEFWGLKSLAYRMKKSRKGHYVFMNVDASGETIHELERNFRINEDVVRYLNIRVDELDAEPTAMMKSRASRDDRGPRRDDDRGPRRDDDRSPRRDDDRGPRRDDRDDRGPRREDRETRGDDR